MKLLLCGGGSGEKTIEANKKFNEIIDHKRPLLYIPLAMDESEHTYNECLKWIKGELSDVNIPNIEIVRTFEELKSISYNEYCAIFIGGGNTFKLLKGIKEVGAFDKIKKYLIEKDGIVYGGSAGAIIFGYDIDSCLVMDDNDVNLKDTKGFNALDGKSIFAHYTNEYTEKAHEKFKKYLIEYSKNREEVIALPEEDTIFIDEGQISIIGNRPYYKFKNGVESKINVTIR